MVKEFQRVKREEIFCDERNALASNISHSRLTNKYILVFRNYCAVAEINNITEYHCKNVRERHSLMGPFRAISVGPVSYCKLNH